MESYPPIFGSPPRRVKAERESLKPDCRPASAILAGPRDSLGDL
jgi:hypothetical protein